MAQKGNKCQAMQMEVDIFSYMGKRNSIFHVGLFELSVFELISVFNHGSVLFMKI